MKIAMFSMGSESSKRIIEALKEHFDEVTHFDVRRVEMRIGKGKPELFYEEKELNEEFDCVYLKSSFRYAVMLKALASYYDGHAYMPIAPEAFTIVHDKVYTHISLEKAGVKTPETYITPSVKEAKNSLDKLNFPIILKIPGGTHGKGVMFAESPAAAAGILDTLSELRQAVMLQAYIETGGRDLRAIVVGDKVVATMGRKAAKNEKRANVHAGGTTEAVELDSHAKKMAVKAAKALKAEICAVDILESVKGPLVLEANISPGLQGIMAATKRDIPTDIAKFLAKETKEFLNEKKSEEHAEKLIEETNEAQQIITKLDFRGDRVLLPEVVSKMASLKEDQEVILKISKGKVELEKS